MRALLLCVLSAASLGAQSVPDRVLVGYWHNWSSPNALRLTQIADAFDVVNVSFATPTTPGGATMRFVPDQGIYPTAQQFAADVAQLQAAGRKVLISIGGANDPVHVDSPADEQAFVTSMQQLVTTYGFDGLDIDLEGSSLFLQAGDTDFRAPTSPRIAHFIAAVRSLMQSMPAEFMLTAAPETAFVQGGQSAYAGVWGAYLPVLHALRGEFDWVQVQHYNTGSMPGRDGRIYQPATADFHVAMADALIGGFPVQGSSVAFPPLRPDQVVIGLPATTQAAGSGYTQAATVHRALDHLLLGDAAGGAYQLARPAGYPSFRGVMAWSINWDATVGGAFSAAHRAYLDTVFLHADAASIRASQGGSVGYTLRGGRGQAGQSYFLVATTSGTTPGTPLPGSPAILPIRLDWMSELSLHPGAGAWFQGFSGTLDGSGRAAARMTLPAVPGAVGLTIHAAWLSPWDFASTPIAFVLAP